MAEFPHGLTVHSLCMKGFSWDSAGLLSTVGEGSVMTLREAEL